MIINTAVNYQKSLEELNSETGTLKSEWIEIINNRTFHKILEIVKNQVHPDLPLSNESRLLFNYGVSKTIAAFTEIPFQYPKDTERDELGKIQNL